MNKEITFLKHNPNYLNDRLGVGDKQLLSNCFAAFVHKYVIDLANAFMEGKAEGQADKATTVKDWQTKKLSDSELDLKIIFNLRKAKESNVVFRIDKDIIKKLNKITVNRSILKNNWKKRFFHLSDSYKFEFGDDCDFYLTNNSNVEVDDFGFSSLKEEITKTIRLFWSQEEERRQSLAERGVGGMFETMDKARKSMEAQYNCSIENVPNFTSDMIPMIHMPRDMAYDPVYRIPKARRKEFQKYVLKRVNVYFKRLFFSFAHHDNEKGNGVTCISMDEPYAYQQEFDNTPESPDGFQIRNEGKEAGEEELPNCIKVMDKLCLCLEFLEFSHNRDFVAKNRGLTNNQRRAAKGLLPNKRHEPRLTGEKIIELPRKEYLSYMRNSKSGTHASPEGHERDKHYRTYKHARYVNMRGVKVLIGKCDVNGGPKGDGRRLVYSVKPSSKMVKDFVENLTDGEKKEI